VQNRRERIKAAWSVALLLALPSPFSFAAEPDWTIVVAPAEVPQGGIAQLRVLGNDIAAMKGVHGKTEITFFPAADGGTLALLGLDLEQRPGPLEVRLQGRSVRGENWKRAATVEVKAKEFPTETISVSAAFEPYRAALKRIEKEKAEFTRLWNIQTSRRLWEGRFVAPVPGASSATFGLRRVINGLARAPHDGVDMKASLGTPVVAANNGRVVLRDNFFFSGNSLVLDHGGGLYTMYFHFSEFRVEKNSLVRKGDVIGLAGMTGRVTGPHLHWASRLNGARVDAMELLEIGEERQQAPPPRLADQPPAETGGRQ
jgi:murein DD-endopeptidase MepM/ murein hydrolase activator NlpD